MSCCFLLGAGGLGKGVFLKLFGLGSFFLGSWVVFGVGLPGKVGWVIFLDFPFHFPSSFCISGVWVIFLHKIIRQSLPVLDFVLMSAAVDVFPSYVTGERPLQPDVPLFLESRLLRGVVSHAPASHLTHLALRRPGSSCRCIECGFHSQYRQR